MTTRFRLAPLLLAFVAVTAAVAAALSIVRVAGQAIDRSRDGELERDLVPTELARLDPSVFIVARRAIPADASYAVIVGDRAPGQPQIALDAAPAFAPYWLLPRRQVYPPSEARWIISYGGDLEGLQLPFRNVIRVGTGMAVAELATP